MIGAVLGRVWASLLFAVVMFGVAVLTAGGRVQARRAWPWIGIALAGGVVPVLAVIFAFQAAAFTGPAIVAIAGIIIGGSMTAHTLTARRAFDVMRADHGQVEAGLALGLHRKMAIGIVIGRHASEAVFPAIDQATRTVGLVTLPGAFVGVLLGGGSASDAAASQLLVLLGLLAAETAVVVISQRLIAEGRILPADLRELLPPS